MQIRIRLFARQREIAGSRAVDIEVSDGATIELAWLALVEQFPALAPGRPFLRFARNGEYAEPATELADGDEVVLIPPVSGGADDDPGDQDADDETAETELPGGGLVALRRGPLESATTPRLVDRLARPADGAVVAFEGRTRITPGTPAPGEEAEAARHAGRTVEALAYEAYAPLALRVLREIAAEAAARFGVERIGIVHAVGEVPLGATSIVVVACAPHRDAAFDAARYAIDETKARAPIWKAEQFVDGVVWVGSRARTAASEREAAEGSG